MGFDPRNAQFFNPKNIHQPEKMTLFIHVLWQEEPGATDFGENM